jgi:hypothetical protein
MTRTSLSNYHKITGGHPAINHDARVRKPKLHYALYFSIDVRGRINHQSDHLIWKLGCTLAMYAGEKFLLRSCGAAPLIARRGRGEPFREGFGRSFSNFQSNYPPLTLCVVCICGSLIWRGSNSCDELARAI